MSDLRTSGIGAWSANMPQMSQRRKKANGWVVMRRNGARMGGDLDVVIVVASGNSAVPAVVFALGGGDIGCVDVEIRDVVGTEEIVA